MTTLTATTTIGTETYSHDPRVEIQSRADGVHVYCPICNSAALTSGPRQFTAKSHRKWCDLAGETVFALVPAAKRATAKTPPTVEGDESIRAAGHTFADADDLVTAVRTGCVSMSAAMNRDD